MGQKNQAEKIIDLERQLYAQQQYSRRETIEFVGIPESVDDKDVEKKVVELCNFAGVPVTERSFHAVHRLKNRRTIIAKLVHRKAAVSILRNKKKLRDTDSATQKKLNVKGRIFVNESLCTPLRRLFGICNSLYKLNVLKSNYCVNGKLFVENTDGTKKIIGHLEDLSKLVGHDIVEKVVSDHAGR